jgi:hypothetical protein
MRRVGVEGCSFTAARAKARWGVANPHQCPLDAKLGGSNKNKRFGEENKRLSLAVDMLEGQLAL